MPRTARRQSESSIYHVINRGEGQQIVFENNADRSFFMRRLDTLLGEEGGTLLAWCLMDNHFHLLLSIPFDQLNRLMHRLQTSYAGYFNRVHGHVGSVFGGRFKSEPVETDAYLMTVVRYIHENPRKAGISRSLDYSWSSYREYRNGRGHADTALVLGVFGGLAQFMSFHKSNHAEERCLETEDNIICRLGDDEARRVADRLLGKGKASSLKGVGRQERDEALAKLKGNGLSVRQIQRLTGISLGTISNAGRK